MKITINQNSDDLDPGANADNPDASLDAYFDLCTKALLVEWPEAEIICNPVGGKPLDCYEWDDEDYLRAGDICSEIYQAGMFW